MDRPLSSNRERDERGDGSSYYGGGGGRGRYGGGRGRGRGGGYRGGYRGGGGGGGRFHRGGRGRGHHPYGGRGGGRGGRGGENRQSNRFYAEPQLHDPRSNLLKQLNSLLHQVGQLPDPTATNASAEPPNELTATPESQRWVVQTMSKNVTSLSSVLCGKAHLFLQSEPNSVDASMVAGPLASGLVQAAAVGPLQTPCYAALALAVQEQDSVMNMTPPEESMNAATPGSSEFASRTVQYAIRVLARDLDTILLVEPPPQEAPPPDFRNSNINRTTSTVEPEPMARIVLRVRLVLRYLGLLTKLGVVAPQQHVNANDDEDHQHDASFDPVVSATNHQPIGFHGLLQSLVQAASLLWQGGGGVGDKTNADLAVLLAYIVYSVMPYLAIGAASSGFWQEQILQPLQSILDTYQSEYEPGVGPKSILLKYEQSDPAVGEEEDDDEEDDDDDDDEGASSQVCDSLQDLKRCVQSIVESGEQPQSYRFALFTDAPWKALTKPRTGPQSMDTGDADEGGMGEDAPPEPLLFTGNPLSLQVFPESLALTMIIGGSVALGGASENVRLKASQIDLQGIVVGRLPIFGSPRGSDDEEEDMEDEEGPRNERLQMYSKTFGLVDRYFLGEAVRDCLLTHEPKVSETGVERGSAKSVAEQIWSIRQLILAVEDSTDPAESAGGATSPSAGLEFVLVEVILSLIVQASRQSDFLGLTYLSRVLLELMKLEPAAVTAATVHAVSTLVEDYMPALVPTARYNLSQWFAFHLIHSNYQWPEGYWKHWEPHVLSGWDNSRGAFVKDALAIMTENLSDPANDLLPHLPNSLATTMAPEETKESPSQINALIQDLDRRVWDMSEDPSTILPHMVGSEIEESTASDIQAEENERYRIFWRTRVVIRALLSSMLREREVLRSSILTAGEQNNDEGMMDQDNTRNSVDTVPQLMDVIRRYRPLIEGVNAKDTETLNGGDATQISLDRESVVLDQISDCCSYARTLFSTVVKIFIDENLISPLGLLRWCVGGGLEETKNMTTLRWWEFAESALSTGGRRLLSGATGSGNTAMDTDDDTNGKSLNLRNVEAFINFVTPMLKSTVERVNSMVLVTQSEGHPKKLAPRDVVAIEGCKTLVRASREMLFSSCSLRDMEEALEAYKASEITGPNLANLCTSSDRIASKVLIQSLERC